MAQRWLKKSHFSAFPSLNSGKVSPPNNRLRLSLSKRILSKARPHSSLACSFFVLIHLVLIYLVPVYLLLIWLNVLPLLLLF